MSVEAQKRAAAERAASFVESGMLVGLGSGSTAAYAVEALAARAAAGLAIRCIPTSDRTAKLARRLGLVLTEFSRDAGIDLDIDGADLIERGTLTLVKGRGGALFREKIVAAASRRMLVIADETKLVDRLGPGTKIPVEISRFGHETVLGRLEEAGAAPALRQDFVTDGGNLVADCMIAAPFDPASLASRLKSIVGVIETGLFVGLAAEAFIGHDGSVEAIRL
jgi:ribose 5-phosphate isomerase A